MIHPAISSLPLFYDRLEILKGSVHLCNFYIIHTECNFNEIEIQKRIVRNSKEKINH